MEKEARKRRTLEPKETFTLSSREPRTSRVQKDIKSGIKIISRTKVQKQRNQRSYLNKNSMKDITEDILETRKIQKRTKQL
jgi:hypothetical protein